MSISLIVNVPKDNPSPPAYLVLKFALLPRPFLGLAPHEGEVPGLTGSIGVRKNLKEKYIMKFLTKILF